MRKEHTSNAFSGNQKIYDKMREKMKAPESNQMNKIVYLREMHNSIIYIFRQLMLLLFGRN